MKTEEQENCGQETDCDGWSRGPDPISLCLNS